MYQEKIAENMPIFKNQNGGHFEFVPAGADWTEKSYRENYSSGAHVPPLPSSCNRGPEVSAQELLYSICSQLHCNVVWSSTFRQTIDTFMVKTLGSEK